MVFLVFTHSIFFFSDARKSNYFGPKAHGLGSHARQSLSYGQGQPWSGYLGPGQQWWSFGLTPALLLA